VADPAKVREILTKLLELMGLDVTIDVRDEADRSVFDVRGADSSLVIGKKGATLEALQYVVGKMLHSGPGPEPEGKPFLIDAEGYRRAREESLAELALRLSEKAISSQKTVTVNPMSPHDRRIIHITLDKVPGVTTRSEGEGVFRRLLVVPDPSKTGADPLKTDATKSEAEPPKT
jgi:spoIIIJ-associated protein